ncbi:9264_t:CDS:2 [Ambispora leptoticha]|uniref:RNA-binding region-containing protein 3 n=1 Tax=Ambispora leptoticha TaxID=144679 RepID=A0A9N9G894_9GLOM|nr:9264_t:CDS:2 [Ambispora leptoticha]
MTLNAPLSLSLTVPSNTVQFLSQETTTLIVKNLPNFSEPHLRDFLSHFGACKVRILNSQKLKNAAFLDFTDRASASTAFAKIQRLDEIGGKRIRVEYALPSKEALRKGKEKETEDRGADKAVNSNNFDDKDSHQQPLPPLPPVPPLPSEGGESISTALGINYPSNPNLHYRYPPPTNEILFNIMSAIAAVPNLYTQVLHLMNKMNLPPPFTAVMPESIPPLLKDQFPELQGDGSNKKRKKRDELLASDESEIESEDEEEKRIKIQGSNKRPKTVTAPVKELRADSLYSNKTFPQPFQPTPVGTFIIPSPLPPHPIVSQSMESLNIVAPISNNSQPYLATQNNKPTNIIVEPSPPPPLQTSKPQPPSLPAAHNKSMSTSYDEYNKEISTKTDLAFDCISYEEINSNKMPEEELQSIAAMKKYTRGEPSATLYIKNLAQKKVESYDLKRIFGRYFKSQEEMESQLDINLLKEGRMRGQAFVKFPDVNLATKALDEVHGYILYDKPMVIQFGRGS